MSNEENQIPFQLQLLIRNLLDKNEKVHIRGNYRLRLGYIRDAIEVALKTYDKEMFTAPPPSSKKIAAKK